MLSPPASRAPVCAFQMAGIMNGQQIATASSFSSEDDYGSGGGGGAAPGDESRSMGTEEGRGSSLARVHGVWGPVVLGEAKDLNPEFASASVLAQTLPSRTSTKLLLAGINAVRCVPLAPHRYGPEAERGKF